MQGPRSTAQDAIPYEMELHVLPTLQLHRQLNIRQERANSRWKVGELADAGMLPDGVAQGEHVATVLLADHLVGGSEVKHEEWVRRERRAGQRRARHRLDDAVIQHHPVPVLNSTPASG